MLLGAHILIQQLVKLEFVDIILLRLRIKAFQAHQK